MKIDHLGNCYAGGFFRGEIVDFGSTTLTNRGRTDGFVNKYDPFGRLVWSRHYGSIGDEEVRQIAFDQEGNVLITGMFGGPIDFGGTNLTAEAEDMFLVKISSDGDCIWAVKAGGELRDFAESVGVDGEGSCYVGGFIHSTNAVFGPFVMTVRSTNSPYPREDPFIAKYNGSGEVQWVQQISSPGYGNGIHVGADPVSGVYVTGSFFGVGVFATTNLTATAKLFVASFDTHGGLRWVNEGGDDSANYGSYGLDVVASTNGKIYVTGYFFDALARFDHPFVTNSSTDRYLTDMFLAEYDKFGTVHWVKSAGGGRSEYGISIAFDETGNLYVAGMFESPIANFSGVLITNAFIYPFGVSSSDGFLAKYGSNGEVISIQRFGGSGADYLWPVAVDLAGNVVVGGAYGSADMNYDLPPPGGGYDAFIAKFESAVPPRLTPRSAGPSSVELSWPALSERFYVETAVSFQSPLNWQSNAVPVERIGMTNRVLIDTATQGRLYRLKRDAP